jgi:osmoprotectant transport system permease protein
LTLYTQLILVRAFMDGFRSVPADALEAADGMGYGPIRRLMTMELPLAMPVLISGIRMATASTIALVPLAFVLSHGGLGETLTLGYSNNLYRQQVVDALIGIVVLALAFDLLILLIGRLLMPWQHRVRAATR